MASDALNVLFKLYKRYYFKKTREVGSNNQFKIPLDRNLNRHGGNIFWFFNIIPFCKMLLQYVHPVSFQPEYGEKMSLRRYQNYVNDSFIKR